MQDLAAFSPAPNARKTGSPFASGHAAFVDDPFASFGADGSSVFGEAVDAFGGDFNVASQPQRSPLNSHVASDFTLPQDFDGNGSEHEDDGQESVPPDADDAFLRGPPSGAGASAMRPGK